MYEVGAFIFYGTTGVCRVDEICHSPFNKEDTREFYVLTPLSRVGNATIYTPVDGSAARIRPLISNDTAREILETGAALGALTVPTDKQRKDTYRAALQSADPREYARLLNTVRIRRSEAQILKRHLPDMDVDFEARAASGLYTELAVVLGRTSEEIASDFYREAVNA